MVVHFKDFYIRPAEASPGEGWFRSRGGKHLRGAVVGNGDIDLAAVARALKASDFSGYASIEFEGWEDRSESTRLNSSHVAISYAVFCLKKRKNTNDRLDR